MTRLRLCRSTVSGILDRKRGEEVYSQKLPVRLICNQPASRPPRANPALVGIRIEPADAGDQPRTAMA